jgi:hypothetical protein
MLVWKLRRIGEVTAGDDRNPESQPPDREFGQIEERIGTCEGDTVVGADGIGQTELPEDILENSEGIGFPGALQGPWRSRTACTVLIAGYGYPDKAVPAAPVSSALPSEGAPACCARSASRSERGAGWHAGKVAASDRSALPDRSCYSDRGSCSRSSARRRTDGTAPPSSLRPQPGNELQSFIHEITLLPGHFALLAKGPIV